MLFLFLFFGIVVLIMVYGWLKVGREGGEGFLLGACVVSSTQYASRVSAIRCPSHLICKCRGVFSRRGGRGKEWTLSLGLGGIGWKAMRTLNCVLCGVEMGIEMGGELPQ